MISQECMKLEEKAGDPLSSSEGTTVPAKFCPLPSPFPGTGELTGLAFLPALLQSR